MKSDPSTLSPINILSKYADDINLIVPQNCDDLAAEFDNILRWAMHNKMTVNLSKTNKIVFRRPCPLRYNLVLSVDQSCCTWYWYWYLSCTQVPFSGTGTGTCTCMQSTGTCTGT